MKFKSWKILGDDSAHRQDVESALAADSKLLRGATDGVWILVSVATDFETLGDEVRRAVESVRRAAIELESSAGGAVVLDLPGDRTRFADAVRSWAESFAAAIDRESSRVRALVYRRECRDIGSALRCLAALPEPHA